VDCDLDAWYLMNMMFKDFDYSIDKDAINDLSAGPDKDSLGF
jgi:hypothetical protein